MAYITTVPPTAEPITLSEAKAQVRELDGGSLVEDDLIRVYIAAAREYAEGVTGLSFLEQTGQDYFDGWQWCYELTRGPVSEIVSVEYIADGATTYTAWANTNYHTDTVSRPARVVKNADASFPALANRVNAVRITYKSGAEDAAGVPPSARHAMLMLVASAYENRENDEVLLATKDKYALGADKALRLIRPT